MRVIREIHRGSHGIYGKNGRRDAWSTRRPARYGPRDLPRRDDRLDARPVRPARAARAGGGALVSDASAAAEVLCQGSGAKLLAPPALGPTALGAAPPIGWVLRSPGALRWTRSPSLLATASPSCRMKLLREFANSRVRAGNVVVREGASGRFLISTGTHARKGCEVSRPPKSPTARSRPCVAQTCYIRSR